MNKILRNNKIYNIYNYKTENEFEKKIVEKADKIFGEYSIYIDIKRRIGNKILSIPDGYLIDYSFPNNPSLFIIENELSSHDPYRHIGSQILKFATSYEESRYKLKDIIKKDLIKNHNTKINSLVKNSTFLNVDEVLDFIIYKKKISAIIIIDDTSDELSEVLSHLTMNTDIITFKTFKNNKEEIHLFEPFNEELIEIKETKTSNRADYDKIDTVVVPARKEGFERVFLGEKCWYAIKMSSTVIDKIKYIAAYQIRPISGVTHYALVDRIEKYDFSNKHKTDTWNYTNQNKYILYFKSKAKKIGPLKLNKMTHLQGPRYTTSEKLFKAKCFDDIF